MIYTYETSKDEDEALVLELLKVNGQLVSQGKIPVDSQGMFTLFVEQHLRPITGMHLQNKISPVITKFINSNAETRTKILAAVDTVIIDSKKSLD